MKRIPKYQYHSKTSLMEVTRWDILRRSQRESPDRFRKKDNYSPKDFKNVDFEDLFTNNTFTWSTRVHGESNYIVTISFEGPFDLLKYDLKSMRGKNRWKRITLPMVTKALSNAMDTEDLYIDCSCPDFCLIGNTLIKTFSGEVFSIEELFAKFQNNANISVYSIDQNQTVKEGIVTDIWISGQATELIEITLDNGRTITTTPNHRYLLNAGDYLEADKLEIGQEIMAIMFDTNINKGSYLVTSINHIILNKPVNVYDLTVDKYNNFYVDAGVILHNCYRFAYHATQADCKWGVPQNRAPTVRNVRNNKGYCCKHILAILYGKRWVQSAAKAWLSYMKANPDLTEYYIWGKELKSDEPEDE